MKTYIGVNGVAKLIYQSGPTLGILPPGSIVKIMEDGTLQEFYVAQHGYPTEGNRRTLLVRRYIYDTRQWHTENVNAYGTSEIDMWLNGAYISLLPTNIQAQVAEVGIPYTPGNGNNTVKTLSRKVFLLSMTELGQFDTYANIEGEGLDIALTLQAATTDTGAARLQWTRSPSIANTTYACFLNQSGRPAAVSCNGVNAARPAFTLPSSTQITADGRIQ